ncbi:MAG: hypothetical protein R6U19_01060 [Bacteroidales bacterium]
MTKWITNPFRYISGGPALFLGLAGILAMAFVSSYSKVHLDGVFDVHFGRSGDFLLFLKENLLTWASLVLTFGVAGLAIRGRSFRFLDLAGYTALMRLPMLPVVFSPFLFDTYTVVDYLLYTFLEIGEPVSVSFTDFLLFFLMLLLIVAFVFWSLFWGYFAFRILFNVSRLKSAALFFVIIIGAEILVKIAILFLLPNLAILPA